jgi:hypothetical protein
MGSMAVLSAVSRSKRVVTVPVLTWVRNPSPPGTWGDWARTGVTQKRRTGAATSRSSPTARASRVNRRPDEPVRDNATRSHLLTDTALELLPRTTVTD